MKPSLDAAYDPLKRIAGQGLRLAIVVIFFWMGVQKFTAYGATGIAPLVNNNPLTSWLNVLGTRGASAFVGCFELAFGLLLTVGFWRPGNLAAIAGALGTYLTTLSFLFTTPGVFTPDTPPLLLSTISVFLVKDIVFLAVSMIMLAHGLVVRRGSAAHERPDSIPGHSQPGYRHQAG